MSNEQNQEGSWNFAFQDIHDSEFNIFIGKSYEFNDLREKLELLEENLSLIPEEQVEKRLKVSDQIVEQKAKIAEFKRGILTLAETFNKIEINTGRLKSARDFFSKGEFGEARAVLEVELEQMHDEQSRLLREKERFEDEILPKLINNSDEFLILALSSQTNYSNPSYIEDVSKHFQNSIRSDSNKENVFLFASFLLSHNKIDDAEKYFLRFINEFRFALEPDEIAASLNNLAVVNARNNEQNRAIEMANEALDIYRELARDNSIYYLSHLSSTLNILGNLYKDENQYDLAKLSYFEALHIRRHLVKKNQENLPLIAVVLNNLGNLYSNNNEYDDALVVYEEALEIRRSLADEVPEVFRTDLAMTLNNMAILHFNIGELDKSENACREALEIYREEARVAPSIFTPQIFSALNNLANTLAVSGRYDDAYVANQEALDLSGSLASVSPDVFMPDYVTALFNLANLHAACERYEDAIRVYHSALEIRFKMRNVRSGANQLGIAQIRYNLALLYFNDLHDPTKAREEAVEVVRILGPMTESVASVGVYVDEALVILKETGMSYEELVEILQNE